jgi:hypothetical protein
MYPWHKLVCDSSYRRSLIDSALHFLSVSEGNVPISIGQRREITPRPIPEDVRRLIESKRLSIDQNFVDEAYYIDRGEWDTPEDTDDLAGVVIFEDLRE